MEQKDRWNNLKREYKNQEIVEEIEVLKEEPKEMTEEEKRKVQKDIKMAVLLICIAIVGVVIFYVVSSLITKDDSKQLPKTPEEEKTFESLPDGEIAIYNEKTQEINNSYDFNINNPLYEANILKLFQEEKVEVKNLDFETKMLLITSNHIFKEYMLEKTNLKDFENKEVSLTKEKLDELSKQILGENITLEHNDFKYYYEAEDEIVYFDVILQNNKYIFTKTTGKPSSIRVYMKLDYSHKISDSLYLQYQVLFINNNGIFSDVNMKKLLSSDITQADNYLYDGSVYRLIFRYNVLDYYIEDFDKAIHEINEGGV